ncbi:ATP-binding protein [Aquihabitans sp. McL0605]|uniref:ATP-binding protein n=1 Tax=Aquihabitans sp. McL0605 TaxID=3415671 RepID=UPI003CEBDDFC
MVAQERLGEVAEQLDAERFVGRRRALDLVDAAVTGTSSHRIVHVHGPGGVGKSALLRAIERQARDRGREVVHLDGRLVAPAPDVLAAEVARADAEGSVLIIDEVDELAPLRFELRSLIRSTLPASSVVVLAGRRPPGREWFDQGLEAISVEVALRPLTIAEGRELLERYDITDATVVEQLLTWAAGYPLALTVGANLRGTPVDSELRANVGADTTDGGLDDVIVARLGGRELAGVDPDVLDVACIAPAVDARLLAAVLPGRATRTGLAQLRALSVSEPLGQRTTLHRLVRSALRSRLRNTDPDRYRTTVVRVADHLRKRALTEDPMIVLELASLVEHPELRLSFDASTTHYADHPRPGDVETVEAFTGAGGTAWFARFRRWCEEQPNQAITVRRATGELVAMSVICMADEMPPWAEDDIETGPFLRHARAAGRLAESGHMHDTIIMEDPDDAAAIAEVIRVGNAGALAAGAVRTPRYVYVTATAWNEHDGTAPLGYQDVPELRRHDDERELSTIMTDFGPDGAVGQIYNLVLMEQQVEPSPQAGVQALALVAALRSFHDDVALAASPLAPADAGDDEAERAEAVREVVRQSIDAAFGPSAPDQELRRAIERTYLDPDGGHGVAQRELHMSRSSFYRHLQKARQHLVDRAAPPPA